jgi:hypothetical protein
MLEHFEVPAREQDEVLDFLSGRKHDVVERQPSTVGVTAAALPA